MGVRNLTERLARASTRHKWLVISCWLLAILASAAAIGGLLGTALTTDNNSTGRPEAQRAEQVLKRAFPPVPSDQGFRVDEAVIVSSSRMHTDDPRFERRIDWLGADLRAAGVGEVRPGAVSKDRRSALLLVELGDDVEPVVERVVAANGQDSSAR